jgi:ent-kaurene oxidase
MQARISYIDFLLEAKNSTQLTDHQLMLLLAESIAAAVDTVLVTTEWAMYELAKNPDKQARKKNDLVYIYLYS